jgi:endoglucanase
MDTQIDFPLLKKLSETGGVSGFEDRVRELVSREIAPYVDSIRTDNIGNLIAFRKGFSAESKKLLVEAHIDEIGFITSYIDDKGFVKFETLGGFDAKTLTAQRVILHGKKDVIGIMGTKAVHMMSPDERNKAPKIEDYFIDLGLPKDEVLKLIEVGTPISRERELIELGNCITGKSLDNRISVYILIEMLKNLEKTPCDLYVVFSVQEEIGIRGANVAAHHINPDFGICVDVTIANDTLGSAPHDYVTQFGKGAAVKIMDGGTVCDTRMTEFLKLTADRDAVAWQPELMTKGGTTTSALQRYGENGAIAGAISVPTRYLHQVTESVNKSDVLACIKLLTSAVETMDKYHWTRVN